MVLKLQRKAKVGKVVFVVVINFEHQVVGVVLMEAVSGLVRASIVGAFAKGVGFVCAPTTGDIGIPEFEGLGKFLKL